MELLRCLNRRPVLLKKDAKGFVANRLQYAMFREAVHIVEEGIALPEEVDEVLMTSFAPRNISIIAALLLPAKYVRIYIRICPVRKKCRN